MNNPKAYKALRGYMIWRNRTQEDLARAIGVNQAGASKRMCGRTEWSRKEMYDVLELLDLTQEYLPILFPADIYEDFIFDGNVA